jgi:hypothetical protein
VRVARGDADVEYTLRMPGYEPQLVRVGANSPATIHVTLQPKAAAVAPVTSGISPRAPGTGPAITPPSAAPAEATPATAAAAAAAPSTPSPAPEATGR